MDPDRRVIADAGIVVAGAQIEAVGKADDLAARYPRAHRLDGRGMVAIPGLIDTHSHADQSLLRGTTDDLHWVPFLRDWIDPWLAQRPQDDLLAAYRLSMLEMVHSGTTCFLSPNVDRRDDLESLTGVIGHAGLRAVLALSAGPRSEHDEGLSLDRPTKAVKQWQGAADGRIQMWFGAMVPRQDGDIYAPKFYPTLADATRELGTGLTYHFCSEIEDAEYYEATFGESPVEWADLHGMLGPNVALINCCWLWEREIEIVAASGSSVVYSPAATMKMASGVTPVPALLEAGVNVSLGTDGGANNNSHDMILEMKVACLVQNVVNRRPGALTAEQALELATIGGARAIGRSHDLGSLEVGKKADVVLVDLGRPHTSPVADPVSNLVYAANGSDVHTVMIDGRLVLRDRLALTLDEEAVLADARSAAARVTGAITPRRPPRWPVS